MLSTFAPKSGGEPHRRLPKKRRGVGIYLKNRDVKYIYLSCAKNVTKSTKFVCLFWRKRR